MGSEPIGKHHIDKISSDLGGYSFGETTDGLPGYRKPGADTVIPFKQVMNPWIIEFPALGGDLKGYMTLTLPYKYRYCDMVLGYYDQGSVSGVKSDGSKVVLVPAQGADVNKSNVDISEYIALYFYRRSAYKMRFTFHD